MTTPYFIAPVFSWPAAPGGKLHCYLAGGTVAQVTYSDAAGVTPNANPVTLDTLGSAVVRLAVGVAYHFVLKDSLDVTTIWDADNYDNAYLTASGLTATSIGTALYPQTATEIAAGVTPINYAYPTGTVDRYGTNTTPGTTVMLSAVTAAFNVALQAGRGTVTFLPNATYFMGNATLDGKTTSLVQITGLSNVFVQGNGCLITCNTTVDLLTGIFQFKNPNNLVFENLNFVDNGFDNTKVNPPFHGAAAFFWTTTTTGNYGGVTLFNCTVTNMIMLSACYVSTGVGRLRGFKFLNCRSTNEIYGLSFQQQGDAVEIDNFVVINPIRAYFPYGVTGHKANITVYNDGTNVNATSDALCPIFRADYDTKEIQLRLTVLGQAYQYGGLVVIEAAATTAPPANLDGIDIDLRLAGATFLGSGVGIPVVIRDQTGSGATLANTGVNFGHVSVRGDFGSWPYAIANPIQVQSTPQLGGLVLSFEGAAFQAVASLPQAYPGTWVKLSPKTYLHTKTGNLTTGLPVIIDVSAYAGTLFVLRITVAANADYTVGGVQQSYRQYVVFGYNVTNAATISLINVAQTYDSGVGTVVSITAVNGVIKTVGTFTGTGTTGTYTGISLTGGTGSGAIGTVLVIAGNVFVVYVSTPGSGYVVNDTLSFTITGGTGTCKVASVAQTLQMAFTAFTSVNAEAHVQVEHLSKNI